MVRHLGFEIPLSITTKQGRQYATASRGVCASCLTRRDRVFLDNDSRPICDLCIAVALARSHSVTRHHPAEQPTEVPYEMVRAAGGRPDNFNSAFWDRHLK